MPYIVGRYGNDCDFTNFAICGCLEGIADDLLMYSESAFTEEGWSLEDYENYYYCEFDKYKALKESKGNDIEPIIRQYSFILCDMYCEVYSYANDTYEELDALLKKHSDEYKENATIEELEKMFWNL